MNLDKLRVLLLEDDKFQRQMVASMLHMLGVGVVLEAGDGMQAMEIVRSRDEAFTDVVVCDLNMPGMDGLEFLRHLGEAHQDVAVIILSGLSGKLLSSAGRMAKLHGTRLLGVIQKPMRMVQLKELLVQYGQAEDKRQQLPSANEVFSLAEILEGVHANQFEPYFQPKVEMRTGNLIGAEALVRWVHPERGLISPNDYIPLLEQHRAIDDLTFRVLEKSAAACRLLHTKGHLLTISVNLSLSSLVDISLAERITAIVRKTGLDPGYMILEITESSAMTDSAYALENLIRLGMNGFTLSIDDYGTGYSSLQQLTRVAFGELKIDQSFVKDLADSEALSIMVESSIAMARKLQVKSVAEGVENLRDWEALKAMGCDSVQGHFISRPMNLTAFVQFCGKYHLQEPFTFIRSHTSEPDFVPSPPTLLH